MRDYSQELNASADTITAPTVHPWAQSPTCGACGLSVGFGIPILRKIMLFSHGRTQSFGYCRGDHNSTMKVRAQFMGVSTEAEMPVECFGVFTPHLHLVCNRCGYRWLMECAPPPTTRPGLLYARRFFKWFFFWLGIGAFLFLCVSALKAQEPSDDPVFSAMYAPKPKPHVTRAEWALLGADLGMRTFDAYSTERALRCACNREVNVPAIAAHPAAEYAYGVGVTGAAFLGVRYLERHNHHRIAMLIPAVDIAYDAPGAIRNMTLPIGTRTGTLIRRLR